MLENSAHYDKDSILVSADSSKITASSTQLKTLGLTFNSMTDLGCSRIGLRDRCTLDDVHVLMHLVQTIHVSVNGDNMNIHKLQPISAMNRLMIVRFILIVKYPLSDSYISFVTIRLNYSLLFY
jgi:hypothetical protein